MASKEGPDRAELAWRIAVPIMALVLSLLAIPLAKLRPRQGRFARIGVAILAYFLYSNLVALAQVWIEKDNARRAPGHVVDAPASAAARHLVPVARRAPRAAVARPGGGGLTCRRSQVTSCGQCLVTRRSCCSVLIALGSLFLFIGQQDDIGTGGYTVREAAIFVALNLPTYIAQLLPVAALIGTLLGLGHLAKGSELVVMRASGISTLQFSRWLAVAGAILAVAMVLVSEFVAPPLENYAQQLKVFSKYDEFSFAGDRGAWVRDGDTIISVEKQSASALYGGIHIFRFDPKRQLYAVGRADSARVDETNHWVLQNYAETQFANLGTSSSREARLAVQSTLSPDFLGLAVVDPATMGCATCARTSATCATTISIRARSRSHCGRVPRASSRS
jgi:lipopolysaccharide export LptBFGC system permease protein LptF